MLSTACVSALHNFNVETKAARLHGMASTARTATHVGAENADVRWLSEAEQLAWRGWIDASRRVLAASHAHDQPCGRHRRQAQGARSLLQPKGHRPAPAAGAGGEEGADQTALIDALQDFKVEAYKGFISGGDVVPRPRVLELMQEARAVGLKVAVCSASAKPAVIHVLSNLLGDEQFAALDCFLAGDDVENKKPHPEIYNLAAERLGLAKEECVVIEDSGVGCSAAMAAGMRCVITYTDSTAGEPFEGAERILADLESPAGFTAADALAGPPPAVVDDRVVANA